MDKGELALEMLARTLNLTFNLGDHLTLYICPPEQLIHSVGRLTEAEEGEEASLPFGLILAAEILAEIFYTMIPSIYDTL